MTLIPGDLVLPFQDSDYPGKNTFSLWRAYPTEDIMPFQPIGFTSEWYSGERGTVLEIAGDWVRILSPRGSGWIHVHWCRRIT